MDENKSGKDALMDFGTFATDTGNGLRIQRLITQREQVRKVLEEKSIRFVSMEAPYLRDFNTELLFALNQFIHEVFLNLQCFVIYFQPTALKKYALPNMKSDEVTKHHMVHQAKTELDKQGKRFSEHVSDAYFAAKIGLRFFQWYIFKTLQDKDLSEWELDYFCGKHTYVRGEKKGITEYYGLIYRENEQFFDYRKHAKNTSQLLLKSV
jgi:Holliday junction resolvasome RuvABC endonuclease subunit